MFKAIYLEGRLELTIKPEGPILIKAGETGSADPSRPDMEFVRTACRGRPEVYIPGSSLKGVVRAQAERIARSLDSAAQQEIRQQERIRRSDDPREPLVPLADNPLGKPKKDDNDELSPGEYKNINDFNFSSGEYFNKLRNELRRQRREQSPDGEHEPEQREQDERLPTDLIYRRSSFVSQLFGHTSLAGRVRFADAYGEGLLVEERNGVAIDRIYGSVAVGPFNYETVVAGTFTTTFDLRNLTLAQMALLGLALRDLAEGRVALGFGKSRGLGRVSVTFDSLTLRYPACDRAADGGLVPMNGTAAIPGNRLAGVGAFMLEKGYVLPAQDTVEMPQGLTYTKDDEWGIGMKLVAKGDTVVRSVWKACMPAWKQAIGWQS